MDRFSILVGFAAASAFWASYILWLQPWDTDYNPIREAKIEDCTPALCSTTRCIDAMEGAKQVWWQQAKPSSIWTYHTDDAGHIWTGFTPMGPEPFKVCKSTKVDTHDNE